MNPKIVVYKASGWNLQPYFYGPWVVVVPSLIRTGQPTFWYCKTWDMAMSHANYHVRYLRAVTDE
jgi:hypothetical protein